jgi:hypothetical protein
MAGGNTYEVFNAGAYNATKNAKQGDLGTKVLKPRPSGTVWPVGSVQRARIEVTATHGGGYVYQLCPAATVNGGNASEIEGCFDKGQVAFARAARGGFSHLVIHADPSKDFEINATIVVGGRFFPKGSVYLCASVLAGIHLCGVRGMVTTLRRNGRSRRRGAEQAGCVTRGRMHR